MGITLSFLLIFIFIIGNYIGFDPEKHKCSLKRLHFSYLNTIYKKEQQRCCSLHMSAMNSPLPKYRSLLFSIPLSHMRLQNYI